jgi:hypothetical protein
MDTLDTTLNATLLTLERVLSRYVVGALLACIFLSLAHVYVTPALSPINHGQGYAVLAHHPFDFAKGHALQNRILTPLVAHYVGIRTGFMFIMFLNAICAFFAATAYVACRHEELPPQIAALAAAIFTFSSPVLFQIHYAGFTDITSYALVFLAVLTVRGRFLWALFLALSLLNHERNLFVYPWFLFYYFLRNDRRVLRTAGAGALMLLSLVPWRLYVQMVASYKTPEFSADHYLGLNWWGTFGTTSAHLYTGFFQTFKLMWALPAYAIIIHARKKNFAEIALYCMIVGCAFMNLFLATDTSRLLCISFPVIWLGFITLAKEWDAPTFYRRVALLFLLSLFVPQYYVGQHREYRFHSLPASWLWLKLFDVGTWEQ